MVEKNNSCLQKVLSQVAEGTDIRQINTGDGGGSESKCDKTQKEMMNHIKADWLPRLWCLYLIASNIWSKFIVTVLMTWPSNSNIFFSFWSVFWVDFFPYYRLYFPTSLHAW